jgi:hypothetical protein
VGDYGDLGFHCCRVPLSGGRWIDELDEFLDQFLVFAEQLQPSHHLDLTSLRQLGSLFIAELAEAFA